MDVSEPVFALNHMCAPDLDIDGFFDLAVGLGIAAVEIRNDLVGNAILDGTPPAALHAAAERRGLRIISINALQRFNDWNAEREAEAGALVDYAKACGAAALVLVPVNDGSGRTDGERQASLRIALARLRPMLDDAGLTGLVEPLGFAACSLRLKAEAAEAIGSLGLAGTFRLVHDTFHHHLAGEHGIFAELTGLVHISGVTDPSVGVADMRDPHRVLVDGDDRLDSLGQIAALRAGGYSGPLSFEPFAASVHTLADPAAALSKSVEYIRSSLSGPAARKSRTGME